MAQRWTKIVGPALTGHPEYAVIDSQYRAWLNGRSKNDIERQEYDDAKSHGKLMSDLFRNVLGIETEKPHPLQEKVADLEEEIKQLRRIIEKKNAEIRSLRESAYS